MRQMKATHRHSYAKGNARYAYAQSHVASQHTPSRLFQMPRNMAQNLPVSLKNSTTVHIQLRQLEIEDMVVIRGSLDGCVLEMYNTYTM